jgi:hypothetical protein
MSKIEGAVIVQNQNHVKTSAALNQITAQLKAINGPKGDSSTSIQYAQSDIRSALAQSIYEHDDLAST